jgi:Membrane-fusion protein
MTDVLIPPEELRQRHHRRWFWLIGLAALVGLALILIWYLLPSGPSVSAKDLLTGTVKQGNFLIQIRAPGTLKTRVQRWITTTVGGTVQIVYIHPGSETNPQTPLFKLSNPHLYSVLQKAQFALTQAQAQAVAQNAQQEDHLYSLEGDLESAKAAAASSEMQVKADASLLQEKVLPRLQYEADRLKAHKDEELVTSLEQRIVAFRKNTTALGEAQEAVIASNRADVATAKADIQALTPLANMSGEVQNVSVHAGQSLVAGAVVARIANAKLLNAVLTVMPSDVGELARGLPVHVLLPNPTEPVLHGTVERISPNVVDGAVPVTVRLRSSLPKGTRPQMAVTGIIRVSRITHTLYVARPAGVQPNTQSSVYVLSPSGDSAVRRTVHFGLASSDGIQILSGLKPGEQIVLSDTSDWHTRMTIRP